MKIKVIMLCAVLLLLQKFGSGQNSILPQLSPKSPNIASFSRYGEIPVSMSTGIPQIEIPLTEISVDEITIPINLSYHCNGFKPDEIASWVGYGWNLQVGGSITWDINGLDDFSSGGLQNTYGSISNYRQGMYNSTQRYQLFEDMIEQLQDSEWDHFSLTLLGNNYLFYFDTLKKIVITPKTDLKISVISAGGFKVLDMQGNQYFFQDAEGSTSADNSDWDLRQAGGSTTYLLSRIVSKNGREIRFRYRFYNYNYNDFSIVKNFINPTENPDCPVSGTTYSDTHIDQNVMLLDSIIYDEGYVKFERTTGNRSDLSMFNTTGVPALASVKVVNSKGRLINQFFLDQSYGTGKLTLDKVREQVSSVEGRQWTFKYFPGGGTSFGSNQKDHWGYYNGASNSNLIPHADYAYMGMPTQGTANRSSNFAFAQQGLLQSIKYPTGGSTEFIWEPNQMRVPSKAYVENLSPFLHWKETDFPYTYVTLADGNSETNAYGTFTLTQETECVIDWYFELDPGYVQDAVITFTGPKLGVDTLFNVLQSGCAFSRPYCSGYGRKVWLPAGSYTWTCNTGWDTYASPMRRLMSTLYLRHSYLDPNLPVPPFELPGGRIKKIISRDSTGINPPLIREYVYQDSLPNISLKNIPNYLTWIDLSVPVGETPFVCNECGIQYSITEESVAPFSGSTIEYGEVTELFDSSGRGGKVDYTFMFSDNIQGDPFVQPNVKPFNTFWEGGKLISKSTFRKVGAGYEKVHDITNSYATTDVSGFMPGMKIDYKSYCSLNTFGGDIPTREHRINYVYLGASRFSQTQTQERRFTNDTISTIENLSYTSSLHTQLTQKESINSKAQSVTIKMIFPLDYTNRSLAISGEALSIRKLADTNIFKPVETITIQKIGGIDYIVGGTIHLYRTDKPVLWKEYNLKVEAPILLSEFVSSSINSSGVFVKDSRYEERVVVTKVDQHGNYVETQLKGGHLITRIFDYKGIYPIAEVQNGDSGSVAYTSFEADGSGYWNIGSGQRITTEGFTGTSSYQLSNGAITKTGLNATKIYQLSYWTKNTIALTITGTQGTAVQTKQLGVWRCFSHKISGVTQISLSGTAIIDELRFHPAGSQMKTWCMEPLQGVITECSQNNVPAYYEYDELGRLVIIRDQNRNIIRKAEYGLGQVE